MSNHPRLALLFGGIFLVWRIVNSRFGMVIQGARSNDARMHAIGFPTYRYRLACFVIAGMMCGLSGALTANNISFISPAMMHSAIRPGDLIVMVVLGGMGSLFGPLIGTITFLALEELLSARHRIFQPVSRPVAASRRDLRALAASRACW